jgi:hypothetical protein
MAGVIVSLIISSSRATQSTNRCPSQQQISFAAQEELDHNIKIQFLSCESFIKIMHCNSDEHTFPLVAPNSEKGSGKVWCSQ